VSELARIFEKAGLTTTGIVLLKEHAMKVKPPRMLAVPFNFGNTLGESNNPELQHEVLRSAFKLLENSEGPVLTDFKVETVSDPIVQGSQVKNTSRQNGISPQDEIKAAMNNYEAWLKQNDGRTAVGLSKVDYSEFPKLVEFLLDFVRGKVRDCSQRPKEVSVARFLRYCVDDLKAFTFESKMATDARMNVNALHQWFWIETAVAELIMDLKESMASDSEDDIKTEAFGIAR